MEIILLALLWPIIILVLGIGFISLSDINAFFVLPAAVILVVVALGFKDYYGLDMSRSSDEDVANKVRRGVVAFSIGLMLPVFIKYLLEAMDSHIIAFVASMILGFGMLVWGMFIKNNKVIKYSNILGGMISVVYLYSELWSLGQLAQVIGAAAGLILAVLVSVLKFKDKLS